MKIEQSLREVAVLALELQPPLVADAATTVGEVIQAMRNEGHGYALITSNNLLTGIFTERDVLLSVLGNDSVLVQPVARHMTPDPVCVGGRDPVRQVVLLMHQGGFRQIPIVDDSGRIKGCVRHKDVAEYLVNHFAAHVLNQPPDPGQIARTPEGG